MWRYEQTFIAYQISVDLQGLVEPPPATAVGTGSLGQKNNNSPVAPTSWDNGEDNPGVNEDWGATEPARDNSVENPHEADGDFDNFKLEETGVEQSCPWIRKTYRF